MSAHKLTRDSGETAEYSNLGVGLLGHALALRASAIALRASAIAGALSAPLLPGWSITTKYGSEITSKNGGTGGYRSFIGFDRAQKKGVVVLSYSASGVDDVGHKVINREFRLLQLVPPKAFVRELQLQGYDNASRLYDEYKLKDANFHLREEILNEWGYEMLAKGRMQDALALLKLGVRLRPNSANTYDSLAEAYDKSGNKVLALENYQRVLELDPQNSTAPARIKALGQPQPAGQN